MAIQFNPEDISNWQFRLSISKVAESTPICSRTFIKPFKLNTLFDSQIVAVGVLVDNAKEHWQDGGEVALDFSFLNSDSRYFDTGISFYSVKKLLINRVTVIELPFVTDAYSLVYFPNPYFQSLTLEVWEYTGDVVDTVADTIEQQLTNLEQRLTDIENNVLEPVNASLVNNTSGFEDILSSLAAISTLISNLSSGIPIEPPIEPPVEPPIEPPTEPEPITTIEAETREVTEEFYTVVTSNLWLLN